MALFYLIIELDYIKLEARSQENLMGKISRINAMFSITGK
jgi:hypothetical protein